MGEFQGSLAILIILFLLCWPAGVIYLVINWKDASYPPMVCPYCGAGVYPNYRACPACGRPFSAPPSYNSPANGPSFGSKACEKCGATVKATDQYCSSCGKNQW